MMPCIACGSSEVDQIAFIEGYIKNSRFAVLRCSSCKTHMSSPHQSGDKVYELIYRNRKVAPGYARYAQFADEVLKVRNPLRFLSLQEEMYYGVVQSIQSNVPNNGDILDVGCGLGYLTYALSKEGYKATGIDISKEAIENAQKTYGNLFVCGDFFSLEGQYDAVCMLELIEHVDDPQAYIEQAKRLLKPGGVIILTTPNRSWFSSGDVWNTDLPPVHITWFSEKGIQEMFTHQKLEPVFFDYAWYNVMYGTLQKPLPAKSVRTPVFDENGQMLTIPYEKSKLRQKAEKLHLYWLLKGCMHILKKIREYITIVGNLSRLSLHRSGTVCISARLVP